MFVHAVRLKDLKIGYVLVSGSKYVELIKQSAKIEMPLTDTCLISELFMTKRKLELGYITFCSLTTFVGNRDFVLHLFLTSRFQNYVGKLLIINDNIFHHLIRLL